MTFLFALLALGMWVGLALYTSSLGSWLLVVCCAGIVLWLWHVDGLPGARYQRRNR